ncbi:MAG: nitrous oxide reductase family maturation protein NosD [Gemmatimonadaceae bacterium]|nr:nitrous oxide reductase family maturation protein NosD [Gemmatimonadaceae bacterium]
MTRQSRILIAISAILLAAVFAVPVWRINLIAPQYPEGLGMLIRINTITGIKPADLNNINGLNHYIGMKAIVPEAIPVLRIMPIAVACLVVLGLVVALWGRRWAAWSWLGLIAAGGAAAMFEFWRWSYDYGHNLAPDAIIKVPGMSYQPPLIGSKQLLNFTATSWPAAGGWLAGLAFVVALIALVPRRRLFAAIRGSRAVGTQAAAGLALLLPGNVAPLAARRDALADSVVVSVSGPVRSLSDALKLVRDGGRIVVRSGSYATHDVVVSRPVSIIGEGFPVLDGQNKGEILKIQADDVIVSGLRFMRVGASYVQDRAAIRVSDARDCRITGNRIDDGFFGIYLAKVTGCRIDGNTLHASGKTEAGSGNGIHLWSSRGISIERNVVSGFRDGIYFEFVHDTRVEGNLSEKNIRYGLHFMYSDDCRYVGNTFRSNGSGVAVMYTKRVEMTGNRFEHNWGSAAYGLLLKEIADSRIERNVFRGNTTGLLADGADRIHASGNTFIGNGWAVKVQGSTQNGRFEGNTFLDNTFDVATNSAQPSTVFEGNFWDAYRGYDLDRDGVGDVPHAPVRLFSMIVERNPQAIVLLRSTLVALLDAAERAMPSLTPQFFVDPKPAMRRPG